MEELNLKKIRKENGITLRDLVHDFNKSYSHLQRVESKPRYARIIDVERYLGLIGYGVDIIEFIRECVEPKPQEQGIDFKELEQKLVEERKRADFYYNECLKLNCELENVKKEAQNYKQIVLKLSTEKYCN